MRPLAGVEPVAERLETIVMEGRAARFPVALLFSHMREYSMHPAPDG